VRIHQPASTNAWNSSSTWAQTVPGEQDGPAEGLTLEANAILVEHEGKKMLRIQELLINNGTKDIAVLTEKIPFGISRDAEGIIVDFRYDGQLKMNNRPIVPSLYPLGPVTLRPGEATRLFNTASGSLVEGIQVGARIRVRYQVSQEWGNRWGIWHGLVGTEVHVRG
jgi:hypothetical protein